MTVQRCGSLSAVWLGLLAAALATAAPPHRHWAAGLSAPEWRAVETTGATGAAPATDGAETPAEAPTAGEQPVVSRIEISGLDKIDERIVRDAMQLKVGIPFDAGKLQSDVDAIYALGWFFFSSNPAVQSSVISRRTDADGNVEVILRLIENPLIDRLEFHGATATLSDDVLAENLPFLKLGQPLNTNPERISRSLRTIERLYRDELQLDVLAALPRPGESPGWFERTSDGRVVVHLNITQRGAGAAPQATPVQGEPLTPVPATGEPAAPATGEPAATATGEPATGQPDTPAATGATETPGEPATPGEGAAGTPGAGGVPGPTGPGRGDGGGAAERLRVTAIEVRGLKNLREDLVLQTISTKVGQVYDKDQLQDDVNAIYQLGWFYSEQDRADLLDRGYPIPAAGGTNVLPEVDREHQGVKIIFNMVENPLIKDVKILNNTLINTSTLLSDLAFLQPGKVLNTDPERIDRDRARVREAYQKQGYYVEVEIGSPQDNVPFLTPEPDGSVTITLSITEFKVGTIDFVWEGRQKTKERVLRAYMRTRPGDFFNSNKITEDLNELRRLDILEEIIWKEPEFDADDPSRMNLTFGVTEKRTGNISAGGGISSRFGLVGFVDVAQNNLWGLAQRGSARVEFGGRFNFTTNYFWPLLDHSGSEVSVRLYNTQDRTGATGFGAFTNRRANFDQTRRGFSVLYSRPIIPTLRGSVQYSLENVATQRRGAQLPNLPPFPFQDLGSDTTSSVTLGLTHDTRDFPFDAAKGMYQNASFEIAGLGGDNNYGKFRLETRHYFPVLGGTVPRGRTDLRPAWVLATRAVAGFSSGDPPFSQSFFVGGSETLRGYAEDRFFGDRMFLFNLELRRAFKNNIQAVAFFDAGRAWFKGESMDFFDQLATAVGVGVRVNTPVGPIRLDLGFGPDGSKTHFSFGQSF